MKRGALETVGSPGMDRAASDEKRAKAGASTATATPHRRGTLLAGAGEEQENLDPAGPIRERIASETGDPARADSDEADDDEAVPDSQVTLGVSSEGDHHLGSVMGTQPAPSPSGSPTDEDDEDFPTGVMPTQPAPMPGDSETAKLRDRVLAETGRRLSEGWRASVETSKKKKRVRFFSPDGKRFGCAKDVVTFVETDHPPGAVGDETATTRNLDAAMENAVEGTGGGDASAEGRTLEKEEEKEEEKEDAEDDDEDVDVAPTQAAPPTEDDDEDEEDGDFEMFAPTQPAPMPEDIDEEGHGDLVAPTPVDPSDASGDDDTSPPAPFSPDDGLTAFERERRANIARNERVMAALNIPHGAMSDKTRDAFEPKAPTQTAPTETAPETPEPPAEEPPVVVVDARPGDAAARFLRRRLLASSGDAAPSSEALEFCPELRDHQRHLVDILSDTITGGQNNSVLLVGARGAGKTLVLDSALRQLRETHGTGVLPVRLNGMLHSDERVGMREIAEQLCAAGEELEFSRAAGFAENVAFMREVLRVLEGGRRSVVFVLEDFDLFAHRPKQTLLYAVMDLLQQTQVQAAVVGVTCRHDAAELLEKRVKSRFSSRRILLAPPVGRMRAATLVRHALSLPLPPLDAEPLDADAAAEAVDADGAGGDGSSSAQPATTSPRAGFEPTVVYPPDPGFAARWNQALDAAVGQVGVDHTLRAYEALECTPRAASDLALFALACMDRDKGVIVAKDIMVASTRLLGDTYVRALSGTSALELCMVVAMSRLHRFRRKAVFNFNHVEDELKNMAANDFLGDAGRAKGPTLSRAFEGLLAMGLVEARTGGVGSGLGGAVTLQRSRGSSGHKHWREIQLLLTDEEVTIAVKKHPTKPAGLLELMTHEGVRQTTAGC